MVNRTSDLAEAGFLLKRQAGTFGNFAAILGERLRHLMARDRMSPDKLSDFLGICRDSLTQIYEGEVVPTVNLIRRIASIFDVTFVSLISPRQRSGTLIFRHAKAAVLNSIDGQFSSRALFPYSCKRRVEFFELKIAAAHAEEVVAHAPGTIECLLVTHGTVEVSSGKELPQVLRKGDAIVFEADVPHRYVNLGKTEAALYLVTSYLRVRDEIDRANSSIAGG